MECPVATCRSLVGLAALLDENSWNWHWRYEQVQMWCSQYGGGSLYFSTFRNPRAGHFSPLVFSPHAWMQSEVFWSSSFQSFSCRRCEFTVAWVYVVHQLFCALHNSITDCAAAHRMSILRLGQKYLPSVSNGKTAELLPTRTFAIRRTRPCRRNTVTLAILRKVGP